MGSCYALVYHAWESRFRPWIADEGGYEAWPQYYSQFLLFGVQTIFIVGFFYIRSLLGSHHSTPLLGPLSDCGVVLLMSIARLVALVVMYHFPTGAPISF